MNLKRSIVLVGLMGAGKTSVGLRLADQLGVPFCDSDDEIVTAAGMSIPEIFESYGEPEFRRLERAVITRILTGPPCVLSTGGGAFIQPEVREAIDGPGISVWLKADTDVLWARVADKPGRPLLNAPDPYKKFSNLAEERNPVYALANVTVPSDENDRQEDVAKLVIETVMRRDENHPDHPIFEKGPVR